MSAKSKSIQTITARFALTWLLCANLVGLLLATLLLHPNLNSLISPFTYGRWMPLHMEWNLYGWTAIPLVGLLIFTYWNNIPNAANWTRLSFILWSSALLVGGISWLGGHASGKPFLNWTEVSRTYLTITLYAIWAILLWGWIKDWSANAKVYDKKPGLMIKGLLLGVLFWVPVILYKTSDATIYPPINPNSGGATGHSLLASTLGIVFVMGILPRIALKLPTKESSLRKLIIFWAAYAINTGLYLLIEHGNATNDSLNQIIGLGSLAIWPPLVVMLWNSHEWTAESKLWRKAFYGWWALLVIDGWLTFFPGILETVKFTNALVAHTHLAMAGMVTAMNMVLVIELGDSQKIKTALSNKIPFILWNFATALYVITMTWQGVREGIDPSTLFTPNSLAQILYSLRWLAGATMIFSNILWLKRTYSKQQTS